MKTPMPLLALAALALLAGCSSPVPPPPSQPVPKAAASTAMTGTPIDPLLKAENRAKGVQKTIDAQAAAQRKAIEKQSQ